MKTTIIAALLAAFTSSVSAQTLAEQLTQGTPQEQGLLDKMPLTLDEAEEGIGKLFDKGRSFFEAPEGEKSEAEKLAEEMQDFKDKALKYGEGLIECTTGQENAELAGPPPVVVTAEQMKAILESGAVEYEVLSIRDPNSGLVYVVE